MYQSTTPTITFTFPDGIDMTQANKIFVTFADNQDNVIINKTGNDLTVTANTVKVTLAQEETTEIPMRGLQAQINWTYADEGITKRACTNIITFDNVSKNLYPEIID